MSILLPSLATDRFKHLFVGSSAGGDDAEYVGWPAKEPAMHVRIACIYPGSLTLSGYSGLEISPPDSSSVEAFVTGVMLEMSPKGLQPSSKLEESTLFFGLE